MRLEYEPYNILMDENYQTPSYSNMYFHQYAPNIFPTIDTQYSGNIRFNTPQNDSELQKIIVYIQNLRNLDKR